MRYLGLDIGKRKIGVAVGELIATELTTLIAGKDESFYESNAQTRSFEEIKKHLESERASAIVVGMPVKEDGSPSEESTKIEDYVHGLQEYTNITIHTVDETLTSFMAREMLESQGLSEKEIDTRVDQLSAQLILQQYLEEHAGL